MDTLTVPQAVLTGDLSFEACASTLEGPFQSYACLHIYGLRALAMIIPVWMFGMLFYRVIRKQMDFTASRGTLVFGGIIVAAVAVPFSLYLVSAVIVVFAHEGLWRLSPDQPKVAFALAVALQCSFFLLFARSKKKRIAAAAIAAAIAAKAAASSKKPTKPKIEW